MQFRLPRIGVAALVALGLAACSNQSTVPSAAPQALSPDAASMRLSMPAMLDDAAIANAASPCKITGFWYFKGSCIIATITKAAGKASMATYKGLSLTVGFSKSDSTSTPFLLGEGTSSADITGTFHSTKFPDYGTVPCLTPTAKTTKCIGKAFLYLLVANASKNSTVTFAGLPSATITNTGKYPGTKKCGVAGLGFTGSGVAGAWFLLPSNAKPIGNKISFPAQSKSFKFGPGNFTVLGFTCQ